MTVLQTIAVAFAMFSAVPVPHFDWNEKNTRYSLCAFPPVGVLRGGLLPHPHLGHGRHPPGWLRRHL